MIVLASQSAVRRRLLEAAGVAFEAVTAPVDERAIRAELLAARQSPASIAQHLATEKASAVSRRRPAAWVLGADQVLEFEGRLVSKSPSLDEAAVWLRRLRGRSHRLISGVALVRDKTTVWQHSDTATLTMRAFSDEFLDYYLARAGEAILGSVGCYHLEGLGVQLFDRIEGDYFTILGLPLLPVLAALRAQGALPP